MSGLEVLKREQGGVLSLLVYRTDGRTPLARACEEAGEDVGFFDPRTSRFNGDGPYKNAQVVTEGFQGELCDHEWGRTGHYGRNPYGTFWRCDRCGVTVATATKKRSEHTEYTYDSWGLRFHIWQKWCKRGPVPGSLQVQEHHK